MKRILSSILISFVILANFLAPFSVGWSDKNKLPNIEIKQQKAEAEYNYGLKVTPTLGNTYINLGIELIEGTATGDYATIVTTSSTAKLELRATVLLNDEKITDDTASNLGSDNKKTALNLDGLESGKPYKTKIELVEVLNSFSASGMPGYAGKTSKTLYEKIIDTPTIEEGEQAVVKEGIDISGKSDTLKTPVYNPDNMPDCSIVPAKIMGCIAQGFYYVLFMPTSYLFALAGTFFDSTFAYSVQDTSYRSAFVVQGWGLVRDFCNLFFIFILLYVAFSTILNVHNFNTKQIIINVVVIGLFINFSLFATQLIIDASNITARVFYNSDAIKITENGANGVTEATPGLVVGEGGVIPLSAALVNKVNPQNLILHSKEVNNIPDKEGRAKSNADAAENLGAGSFILIVIIASAVNIVGIIVFLSVGLMFIARVIGLWLAMIMAPLAFFTYILPEQMAGIKMIGWKNWWPETFKLAFLAPVFMFFMYIILKFLSLDLIADVSNKTISKDGLGFFVATLIPFAFIMILMLKAKGIAKDMSGELGQQITGGVAAAGGMLLGGAALSTAFLGRKIVGQGLAKASKGDTASQQYMDPAKRANMNILRKSLGFVGSGFGTGYGINKVHDYTGGQLNKKQKTIEEIDHARHTVDSVKDKRYKDIEWSRLSNTQQQNVRGDFVKENKSKWAQDEEDAYRKSKKYNDKKALTPTEIAELRDRVTARANKEFDHEIKLSTTKVKGLNRAISQINTGSMDIRKLSEIKSDKREGFFTKMPVALTAAIAMGMRTGIKSSGLSGGSIKVEGNFMKDLTNTISDSLKQAKVNVDISHVGETKSSADPHAGGHH